MEYGDGVCSRLERSVLRKSIVKAQEENLAPKLRSRNYWIINCSMQKVFSSILRLCFSVHDEQSLGLTNLCKSRIHPHAATFKEHGPRFCEERT